MNNNTKIAFGQHIGKELKDVPKQYFTWLMKQEWFVKCTYSYEVELKKYIADAKNIDRRPDKQG